MNDKQKVLPEVWHYVVSLDGVVKLETMDSEDASKYHKKLKSMGLSPVVEHKKKT